MKKEDLHDCSAHGERFKNANDPLSAIFAAAETGDLDSVSSLLAEGADAYVADSKGLTPLGVAVLKNHTETALHLLFHCPSCVNIRDSSNNLPLHYAVRNGNTQLVSALINNGSQKNVLNRSFESPVHLAVAGGKLDVLRLLVKGGCDVNLCEPYGNVTPLHVAVNVHNELSLFRPLLDILLEGGCILNWRAFSTLETPLYRSLGLEKFDFSKELLCEGADPNLASPFDITALQRACLKRQVNLVSLILPCGIDWKRERWLKHFDLAQCGREIAELISEWKDHVVPLQALCRMFIRSYLGEQLRGKVSRLPVPKKVQMFLLMQDCL